MILLGRLPFRWGSPPPSVSAGYRSLFGRWAGGGFGAPVVKVTKKKIGWMPEWGFRHDPEELERRLKAQRESAFSPQWLDRFLLAEERARKRVGKAKGAHRAALEGAIEQSAARVSEAIDAGWAAPERLIIELEAAANSTRATASLKHAQLVIEMAQAILMDEDDEILLLLG